MNSFVSAIILCSDLINVQAKTQSSGSVSGSKHIPFFGSNLVGGGHMIFLFTVRSLKLVQGSTRCIMILTAIGQIQVR